MFEIVKFYPHVLYTYVLCTNYNQQQENLFASSMKQQKKEKEKKNWVAVNHTYIDYIWFSRENKKCYKNMYTKMCKMLLMKLQCLPIYIF